MRKTITKLLATVPLAMLLFLAAPVLQAPASGRQVQVLGVAFPPPSAPAMALASPNPALFNARHAHGLPLQVWECVSTWYGEPFDGQPTASGEVYDMYAQTAAHPTLPLGSVIRITNTRTRQSTIVRINDRGPYVDGRDLDVSFEVARRLGFDQRGLARVRVELLEVPQRPASASHSSN